MAATGPEMSMVPVVMKRMAKFLVQRITNSVPNSVRAGSVSDGLSCLQVSKTVSYASGSCIYDPFRVDPWLNDLYHQILRLTSSVLKNRRAACATDTAVISTMTNPIEIDPPTAIDDRPRRPRPVVEHWAWLVLACAIIVASFSLEVRGTEQVGSSFGPDFVLPNLCYYRALLGVNCPGCGLTRSFIYLAHGNWRASWDMHHLGWFFAAAVVWQVPYRIYCLFGPGKARVSKSMIHWLSCGLIAVFLANWLLGLLTSN